MGGVIILSSTTFSVLNAQGCPSGYTQYSTTFAYEGYESGDPNQACVGQATVYFCLKCSPLGNDFDIKITLITAATDCVPYDMQSYKNDALQAALNYIAINLSGCAIPSCNGG